MSNNQYVKSKLQEELVEKLNQEGVIEFIMSLGGSLTDFDYRSLNTLTLEIFHHIFYGRNIDDFFQTSGTAKSGLQDMLKKEKLSRKVIVNLGKRQTQDTPDLEVPMQSKPIVANKFTRLQYPHKLG